MKVEQGRGERDKKLQCYSNTNNQKFIEFSETVKIYTLAFCAFFFFASGLACSKIQIWSFFEEASWRLKSFYLSNVFLFPFIQIAYKTLGWKTKQVNKRTQLTRHTIKAKNKKQGKNVSSKHKNQIMFKKIKKNFQTDTNIICM